MQTIHLMEYHLGGAPQGGAASEGATPSPQLPDAGKPYVESVSYDKDAKKVRLRAQNARAGEVKTPLGDWQEFPVDVPEPTPLPDAGKPFVEGVTYDPDTNKVKVRAKVAQAGEVKDPIGEEQEFPISSVLQGKGWFINKVRYQLLVDNKSSSVRQIRNNLSNELYSIQPGEEKVIDVYTDARSGPPVGMYRFIGGIVNHVIHPTSGLLTIAIAVKYTDAIEL